jgi:aminopeptidase N
MMFRRPGWLVLLAALVAVAACAVALSWVATMQSGAVMGAAGLGDPLFSAAGNGGYDVERYTLDFDIQNPEKPFPATVTVDAMATQVLGRFDLDLAGHTVQSVTVDGRRADFRRHDEELVITPDRRLRQGRPFHVVVRYTADPGYPGAHSAWMRHPGGFALAAQPASAHTAFPANDHPSDKAYFTIRLTVPDGSTAIANGSLIDERHEDGRTTVTYSARDPMATELVQIAVGPYTLVRGQGPHGVPLRSAVSPDRVAVISPMLDRIADHITWLEARLGPYPFENYGVVTSAGVSGFALETQTLSLFDDRFLIGPASATEPVMVHELSHQWFGDSVTPRTWADLWLNEGHATWYEWLYGVERNWPDPSGRVTLEDRMKEAYAHSELWRRTFGPPGSPGVENFYSPSVYNGGALVLYALRQQVGLEAFARIERAWVSEHRNGVADARDFINLASRITGQDLGSFLTDWIYGTKTPAMPGHSDWTIDPVPLMPTGQPDSARTSARRGD